MSTLEAANKANGINDEVKHSSNKEILMDLDEIKKLLNN